MGSICSGDDEFADGASFKPGEQYFINEVDRNPNRDAQSNKLRDKVDLYFSLVDVVNPSKMHSFSITIINNAKLNIETYLGDLEERSGKEIQFGKSFTVNYYFQREQLLLITPKLNGIQAGERQQITLSDLIRNPQETKIFFQGIGTLKIAFKQKRMDYPKSENYISSFEMKFHLSHKIFNEPINTQEMYFIIYIADNNIKRALYKSQEFYDKNIVSNIINLDNEWLMSNGNANTPLYLVLFCPHLRKNQYIGFGEFNLRLLEYNLTRDQITTIPLSSKKYGNIGNFLINYNQTVKLGFIEYLSKGMQINLDIAIDYTASNNDPHTNPIPLHNIDPRYPNDYEKAIESCGSIVAFYDYDQLFPVYGFGGVPKTPDNPNGMVSHCFNINFKGDPNIHGINNIILAYRESLSKVTLATPTSFSPVIEKVIQEVKYDMEYNREENHYYILLILTDGFINDAQQTRDKIVEASYLPMSIIIVGIGKADFTLMNLLDGDEEPVRNSRGEPWKRDIVQFVEFEKFKISGAVDYGTDLTEEVLKEIPTQVEKYFQLCGKFYE